jgi:hypothetical protein
VLRNWRFRLVSDSIKWHVILRPEHRFCSASLLFRWDDELFAPVPLHHHSVDFFAAKMPVLGSVIAYISPGNVEHRSLRHHST